MNYLPLILAWAILGILESQEAKITTCSRKRLSIISLVAKKTCKLKEKERSKGKEKIGKKSEIPEKKGNSKKKSFDKDLFIAKAL